VSRVFVDTSALLALLIPTDESHHDAATAFARLRDREAVLVTTSYVLVETYALLDRRVGRGAVAAFREDFAPLLEVEWVDRNLHERGLDLQMVRPRGVSLVDAVSFACIRKARIDEAFAYDRHFEQEGFASVC